MKRVAALVVTLLGCGATTSSAPRAAPPSEADSCARACDRLASCDLQTYECRARCDEDQAQLRPGVHPAYVDCLERELPAVNCKVMEPPERRGKVAVCWTATTEAWAAQEQGAAMRKVVQAICTRTVRCAPDGPPEGKAGAGLSLDECVKEMDARTRESARARSLGVIKASLVDALSTCVAAAPCEGDDPLAACKSPPQNTTP